MRLPKQDGAEIDVRSNKGEMYLAHSVTDDGESFEKWLEHYDLDGPLVINVKEEGLEELIIPLLERHNVTNYMFLDEPFWFLLKARKKYNNKNFAIRVSKYESVETAFLSRDLSDWIWYDYFEDWIDPNDIIMLVRKGFKVVMPSPELVDSDVDYMDVLRENNIDIYAVCRDFKEKIDEES